MRAGVWAIIGGSALVLAVLAVVGYLALNPGPKAYASEEENFKYGSVGVQAASGLPYEIWRVLPDVCSNQAPTGGYAAFGMIFEPGHDAPIGMPLETVLVLRIGVNCALCHVGQVQDAPGAPPRLLVGAPNTRFDLQRYLRFVFACAASDRFNPDEILTQIQRHHIVNPIEGLLYRYVVIPQARKAILQQQSELNFMDRQPTWGPGRADGFNPAKAQVLHQTYDGSIDAVDIPALWNERAHAGFGFHWDAINTDLREVFLNSGIGNGASARSIDVKNLDRMRAFVMDLKPAAYPYPIDAALAARGKVVFEGSCAGCHALGSRKVGTPIDIQQIGTDRRRLDTWTLKALSGFQNITAYSWRYKHFRKTSGYASVSLDGIWARAPYLHNGSVASLNDLLTPPAQRPARFYRGNLVYDRVGVGFVSQGPAAQAGWVYETAQPGNSAQGHIYGTALPTPDRMALIEYMKGL